MIQFVAQTVACYNWKVTHSPGFRFLSRVSVLQRLETNRVKWIVSKAEVGASTEGLLEPGQLQSVAHNCIMNYIWTQMLPLQPATFKSLHTEMYYLLTLQNKAPDNKASTRLRAQRGSTMNTVVIICKMSLHKGISVIQHYNQQGWVTGGKFGSIMPALILHH